MTSKPFITWHTCECGKRAFYSRKDAKCWARQMNGSHKGLSAYECHYSPGRWHFGHAPTLLRRGVISRDQVQQQKRGTP